MSNDAPNRDADDPSLQSTWKPSRSTEFERKNRRDLDRHQKATTMLNLLYAERVGRIVELDINEIDNEAVRFVAEIHRHVGVDYPPWWTVVADGRATYTKYPTIDGALIMAAALKHHDPETAHAVTEFAARALSVPTHFL